MVENMKKSFDRERIRLGARIRGFRKGCDLTQESMAEKLDVSVITLSRIENGATVLDVCLLLKMSKILKVPIDVLVGETSADDRSEKKET